MILNYDVLVIGGGHAGCEAACAAANMGAKTCLVTMDMNKIAQMSCNPAVGGIAKGQIVREIDALGGQMGLVTDATAIQFRMLNRSKGPAMWSPRAQCDRGKFIWEWRRRLDETPNLDIWQDQAEELLVEETGVAVAQQHTGQEKEREETGVAVAQQHTGQEKEREETEGLGKRVTGVRTIWGVELRAKAVIITAGTFLNGLMHIGKKMVAGGRIAEPAVPHFTESITRHGIRAARMKTGTPVRIDKRSVHFEDLEVQEGEHDFHQFSYMGEHRQLPQLTCWTCNTNAAVHETLRTGLKDSPLYNGQIQSIGPRYCPSIETKLMTFPDREQHPLFLEPEGTDTNELYLNGFSSSLPMEVQIAALRHIPAFRDLKVYRPGYAIEYDFFDPTQLKHSLESKVIEGLFMAGQVNGTTGYEEAGGQGTVAGINAALMAGRGGAGGTGRTGETEGAGGCCGTATYGTFVLQRDEAYIGVLIDDLVTKGVDEPYRMFTSRAEYRILLRQDDADARLTEKAYELGIAKRDRYDWWMEKKKYIEEIENFCHTFPIKPKVINGALEALGSTPLVYGCKLEDLVGRPELNFQNLQEVIPELKEILNRPHQRKEEIAEAAEVHIKYKGYIERERIVADKMHRLENIKIKGKFDYPNLTAVSTEARQKLEKIQPETLAQASRIPGVSPSDINAMLVLMGR